ncbi:MAG: MFS transporter [Coriobacteriia bacterium]|nr:MFS transporter [Coriobacteriia bacterium]
MTLSKKKLLAFGFAAIGINLLNLMIGVYLCDALLTYGFEVNIENWTYLNKNLVNASVWAFVITFAKIIDGVIDVPLANFLDNMKSKFGKRKLGIILGFVPMVVSFFLFLIPAFGDNQNLNTVWFAIFLILFYCSYTCVMLAYYASFSEITENDNDRQFLSSVKSVADVVSYVLVFALIPVLVTIMNIRVIVMIFSPLSLLVIIALFFLRNENEKPDEPVEKEPGMIKSFLYVIKNKDYIRWMLVYCLVNFSIQLFLVGQNVFLSGVALFNGGQISIVNACAFAPVPATIALYYFIIRRRGFKFGFVYAMLTFVVGMIICFFCNANFVQDVMTRQIIAIAGGLACSFGIGTFFSVTYFIPSHLAAKEKAETGHSQPGMYFAIQGLIGAGMTAISTGIIWVNIKVLGLTWLVTAFVAVSLLICCLLTFILPKSFSQLGRVEKGAKKSRKGAVEEA